MRTELRARSGWWADFKEGFENRAMWVPVVMIGVVVLILATSGLLSAARLERVERAVRALQLQQAKPSPQSARTPNSGASTPATADSSVPQSQPTTTNASGKSPE